MKRRGWNVSISCQKSEVVKFWFVDTTFGGGTISIIFGGTISIIFGGAICIIGKTGSHGAAADVTCHMLATSQIQMTFKYKKLIQMTFKYKYKYKWNLNTKEIITSITYIASSSKISLELLIWSPHEITLKLKFPLAKIDFTKAAYPKL